MIYINNRDISFEDLIIISQYKIICNNPKINYLTIWKNKIDYLDNYYKNYYEIDNYDFNYFKNLSEISLNIVRNINYNNLTYGITYNRFYNIKNIYDLHSSFNISCGPIINSFSEFIKYNFFYNNKKIDYYSIFDLDLNIDDYYFFVARLIFPTYYFDLLKDNRIEKYYQIIINNYYNYIDFIKSIILEIKKRHNDMPLLDNIISLL